eukprot:5900780-Amphidinium_carterae.1
MSTFGQMWFVSAQCGWLGHVIAGADALMSRSCLVAALPTSVWCMIGGVDVTNCLVFGAILANGVSACFFTSPLELPDQHGGG